MIGLCVLSTDITRPALLGEGMDHINFETFLVKQLWCSSSPCFFRCDAFKTSLTYFFITSKEKNCDVGPM